jgi:hypothetical protein
MRNTYAMKTSSALSAAALEALRPELPALADEIVEAIRREVPEYARPLRGDFGRGIRAGVEEALAQFGSPAGETRAQVYRALGRGELREGRSLDALQSAYRIGARVAWRRLSGAAERAGVPVAEQHALAEAIFAYIDALAAESVEGYAAAQAALAGDRQRHREALLALLTAAVAPDEATLTAAAAAADWRLPQRLAAIACEDPEPGRVARRFSGDPLPGRAGEQPLVLVGEPAGLREEAAAAARRLGTRLAVGPSVPLAEARRSADWAARALNLAAGDVVFAEDHLADLALQSAPEVMAALRARVLAPLDGETPRSRERLAATLSGWLRHAGARAAVAEELGVHPQTVRYRVARLRELFGARIDDPEARFELMLALR